jgi:hypothetical protein
VTENNKQPGPIRTVSDMMRALESEIQSIKDGTLPLDAARAIRSFRALQLRTAEMQIQYARMHRVGKAVHTGPEMRLIETVKIEDVKEVKEEQPQAESDGAATKQDETGT